MYQKITMLRCRPKYDQRGRHSAEYHITFAIRSTDLLKLAIRMSYQHQNTVTFSSRKQLIRSRLTGPFGLDTIVRIV